MFNCTCNQQEKTDFILLTKKLKMNKYKYFNNAMYILILPGMSFGPVIVPEKFTGMGTVPARR